MFQEIKDLQKTNESLNAKLSNAEASSITEKAETINDVTVLAQKVDVKDMNQLRNMVDELKQKLGSGVIYWRRKRMKKFSLLPELRQI